MQKIIILGKPNVGKSSLFNCFLKERVAITSNISGTTRDINIKQITLNGINVMLCDTAGIIEKSEGIFIKSKEQTLSFITKNDIVLYVLDSQDIIDDYDVKLFRRFENAILVVNKIDLKKNIDDWEYGIFGAKNIFFISTAHNRGLSGLRDFITFQITQNVEANPNFDLLNSLEAESSSQDTKEQINIGIIGRVNVGKSSLLNALLGKNRSLVSEIEGTTIDPIDDCIEHKGRILNFVDTAGIRKKSKIEGIEKYALERTKKVLELSDIVLLVLDSSKEFYELDEKISGLSDKYKLGIIIIFNKWDICYADFKHISDEFRRKFAYLSYAPIITASAINKRHIDNIKDMIIEVWEHFNTRIPTALLNESIKNATLKHPLPSDKGKMVKIYYATQIATKPPQIVLVMNKPNSLHFSYRRYLINYLRKHYDFTGSPILILPRPKNTDLAHSNHNE